jgi:hypothetical protein
MSSRKKKRPTRRKRSRQARLEENVVDSLVAPCVAPIFADFHSKTLSNVRPTRASLLVRSKKLT